MVLVCILPARELPGPGAAPLRGQPLEGLPLHSLCLWVRRASHPPVASLEEVRAHHRIVEAAWSAHPAVLPVRFGQWFATAEVLEEGVAPREDDYRAALERVRGGAEYSFHVLDPAIPDEPDEPAGSGTAYLRAASDRARRRALAEARGREVAAELRAALGGMVREERVDPLGTPHGLVAVAHLIERARGEEYEELARRFADERPALRFLRTGPWPAWSFTA